MVAPPAGALRALAAGAPAARGVAPLQVEPAAGGVLAFVGTFLFGWAFFTFTAQIAATFFLGDVPWRRAVVVGLVPAVVNLALIRYQVALILAIALVADFVAIHMVYRVRYRTTALVTLLHAAASIALSVPLTYLIGLLGTAPG